MWTQSLFKWVEYSNLVVIDFNVYKLQNKNM